LDFTVRLRFYQGVVVADAGNRAGEFELAVTTRTRSNRTDRHLVQPLVRGLKTSSLPDDFQSERISRAVVVVDVNKPATPVGAPEESKMSALLGVTGTAKFA
jgi:hypothetical protein